MNEPQRNIKGLHWLSTDQKLTVRRPATEPSEKKQTNKAVTIYISPEVYTKARLAYHATRSAEDDRTWSHFVEKAIADEVARREQRHNGGDPFGGVDTPLSPGRPLAD
ncbi:hypothetical protein WDY80_09490 [Gordonia hongkongensis]|uniref:ParB family protein n=1 Tax=Gordonia TaxID=2053 RepID=UPI001CFA52A6|nr:MULTISPECIES: hypothetical protein [Gordonia]MDJ0096972.1 hypothetical protein [Gordonia alkanivorans]UCZ90276.1 hypothetical protein LEL84_00745 [Gordonia sp. WA4-43]